jgi:hypothetical protein
MSKLDLEPEKKKDGELNLHTKIFTALKQDRSPYSTH